MSIPMFCVQRGLQLIIVIKEVATAVQVVETILPPLGQMMLASKVSSYSATPKYDYISYTNSKNGAGS